MDEEVERHRSISGSLKVELQALKERILLVECLPQNSDLESTSVHTGEKISRKLPSELLELNEALTQIKLLEKENAEKDREMNQEKDQELSVARLRVQELEALAASRQKEVCMLQTRLATTESMTRDVIRDLLGVKLDITNYANLIGQNEIVKLVEEAHQQREEFFAKRNS
ncbi:phragmoplast orienting kinesin [Trifolium repens]|nr:phragmoplast orienting kinesin [Trifolium repens]